MTTEQIVADMVESRRPAPMIVAPLVDKYRAYAILRDGQADFPPDMDAEANLVFDLIVAEVATWAEFEN